MLTERERFQRDRENLIAALGAYLWRGASRVRRAQRWPPPGARTLRDTPVLTGAAARRRARGMQAVALALWLVALALPVLAWRLHAALAPAAA